ncbi:MAG: Hsp33 family molecular chaperone HslO [Erysipelotrichaceae bacterium]|nr:Hsp33 family molecular chaperone HslO [Erysipelotrichaceae bacterium]
MKDSLIKATALNGNVRIIAARTTELVEQSRKQHDLWPTSCAALGRIESMGAIMASMLKGEKERVIIQINGGGAIGTCMVEAHPNGDVRGFVGDPHIYLKYNDSNKLAVGLAVGNNGYLTVTKDLGLKDNFSGKVELRTGEIGDDFAYYFLISEQTPSVVSVGVLVDVDYSCKAAGGMIIQMMPDATEEDIVKVEEIVQKMEPISTYMDRGMAPGEVIKLLFEDAILYDPQDVQWHCGCDKERFRAALTTLKYEDIEDMIAQDHGCSVRCDFCNSTYTFDEDELKRILDFKRACGK